MGRTPGTFSQSRVVLGEHAGWVEGPRGVGALHFPYRPARMGPSAAGQRLVPRTLGLYPAACLLG